MSWLLAVALMVVVTAAAGSVLLCLPVMVAAESLVGRGAAAARRFWLTAAYLPLAGGLLLTPVALATLGGDIAASPHQARVRPHVCPVPLTNLPDAPFRFRIYGALALGLLLAATVRFAVSLAMATRATHALGAMPKAGGAAPVVEIPADWPQCFSLGAARSVIVCTSGWRGLLTEEEQAAVLAHEQCHARRRDPLGELLLRLATDALIWLPTTHYYLHNARAARELYCDEAAVAATSAGALASALRKMAEAGRERHRRRAGDLSVLRPTFAEHAEPSHRLRALTEEPEATLAPRPAVILAIELAALLAAVGWFWRPLHDTFYCWAESLLAVMARS